MNVPLNVLPPEAVREAVAHLREATAARKCWSCGCLHGTLGAIERAVPEEERPEELRAAVRAARSRLVDIRYECLGCEVCWPAAAMNALGVESEACPVEEVQARAGWPPLPGSYTVLRYHAPVAICTLTDAELANRLSRAAGGNLAIVGTLFTENLGIERIVQNVLANPHIRFLIVCGPDSRQTIGHLPGQSLVSLARNGVDERMRIVEARGRRPVLKNLPREAIDHFRRTVEVLDMVGHQSVPDILREAAACATRNAGPAEPFRAERGIETLAGYLPERMVSDPSGYFVVYVDRDHARIVLEHYRNDGVLDVVIAGRGAAEVYTPAVERGLLSRLDHAAYLGRELARAEHALRTGEPYVQDAAPDTTTRHPPAAEACVSSGAGTDVSAEALSLTMTTVASWGQRGGYPRWRWLLPVGIFATVLTGHFAWLTYVSGVQKPIPDRTRADGGNGAVCSDALSCGDADGALACASAAPGASVTSSRLRTSAFAGYVAGQHYWLGMSYAASLAFAGTALRRYRERKLCAARNLAIGSVGIAGTVAIMGCYLLGCCGSPMLGVYLSLLGAAFLPLAKPLVALLTAVLLLTGWWWMRRRERMALGALDSCPAPRTCGCAPSKTSG